MLDVLVKEGVTDVAVVVTRYFGGVLLGTGGLVRAYQQAVSEGLRHCQVIEKKAGMKLSVVPPWLALAAVVFAVFIAMAAGFLPSLRAMKLSPLAAIRAE
jgi:ABC-type antimicrobial peptide transport system permease subunit